MCSFDCSSYMQVPITTNNDAHSRYVSPFLGKNYAGGSLRLDSHCAIWSAAACCRFRACGNVPSSLKRKQACALRRKAAKRNLVVRVFVSSWWLGRGLYHEDTQTRRIKSTGNLIHCEDDLLV